MVTRRKDPPADADDGFVYTDSDTIESEPYDELDELGELEDEDESDED
jgi:hypothetical protein